MSGSDDDDISTTGGGETDRAVAAAASIPNENDNHEANTSPAAASPSRPNHRRCHPARHFKGDAVQSKEEHVAQIQQFLRQQAAQQHRCLRRDDGSVEPRLCRCLQALNNDTVLTAVSEYVQDFSRKTKREQQFALAERIRYAKHTQIPARDKTLAHCHYAWPFVDPGGTNMLKGEALTILLSNRICQAALQLVLCVGRTFWGNCCKTAETGIVKQHGLKNAKSNRQNPVVVAALTEFLDDLKAKAVPVEGTNIRITAVSKRQAFQQFMYPRGYVVTYNAKGTITCHDRVDEEWQETAASSSSASLPFPKTSWSTFLSVWNRNYADLRTQSKNARKAYKYAATTLATDSDE